MAAASPWVIKRESPVHGMGLFAARFIPQGTAVIACGGRRLRTDELTPTMRAMQIGEDLWLAEDPAAENLDDYLNHCCDPNIGFTDGTLVFHALRDIAEGQELLWHYSTSINEAGWGFSCRCGSPSCRGKVVSFCDLPPDERDRLRPLALAYLR